MPVLDQYILFISKALTFVFILVLILSSRKEKTTPGPSIEHYNKSQFSMLRDACKSLSHLPHFKSVKKSLKKDAKAFNKANKNLYVIDFDGDMKATQVESLRNEINLILALAGEQDQVLLRLNSPGGTVTGYGLAASQVHRIRQAGLTLTISIDQMAASGGYMIASLAHEIIAAPFACIGSIGVAYELPNFNEFLAKRGIDYKQVTAGKYKRTLSLLGKNTKEGEAKVQEDINATHQLFTAHVSQYRELDLDDVATGETWPALLAHEKGLVDKIYTSDEFINDHLSSHAILIIKTKATTGLMKLLKKKATALIQSIS